MTFTTTPRSRLTSGAPLFSIGALVLACIGMGLIAFTSSVHAEPGLSGRFVGRGKAS
jgi:hypothetical protein